MFNNIGLIAAYAGVGVVVLIAGFFAIDFLTPGSLRKHVENNNRGAAILTGSTLASLGLVSAFAIYFTGSGWEHLGHVAVYGLEAVALQAAAFAILDAIVPGKLGDHCITGGKCSTGDPKGPLDVAHSAVYAVVGLQFALAFIFAAALT